MPTDLAGWEATLDRLDGKRVHFQQRARQELTDEGVLLTRTAVLQRAAHLSQATTCTPARPDVGLDTPSDPAEQPALPTVSA